MAKATTTPPTRTLERIPLDKVVTGLNVRTDATPDPELVASIKANGILQPPTVTLLDNGDYEIVIGHRRANAAAKAGLTEIDALVVPAALAEEIRLVEQIVENEHRQNLTDAERAGGYRQLELFAISPAQIAARLGVRRDRVDTVLKVTGNEVAAAAVAEHGVPLDLAAQMVEFADDKGAIKRLTDTATTDPARFDHVIAEVRRDVELKAHKAALQRELEATGVRRLKTATGYMYGNPTDEPKAVDIKNLGHPDDPTRTLTLDDIRGKEYAAGRIREDWMIPEGEERSRLWARIEYFVVDPEAHGIPRRQIAASTPEPRELTPEEIAAQERREAERVAREAKEAARAAATEVRRAWIRDLLQRKNLPDASALILQVMLDEYGGVAEDEYPVGALDMLGIEHPADFSWYDAADLVRLRLTETPANGMRFLLAAALHVAESEVGRSYHPPYRLDIDYLNTLASWGYGLSDAELEQLTEAAAALAAQERREADAEPEDSDDVDDEELEDEEFDEEEAED